jgi:hypothetical protein
MTFAVLAAALVSAAPSPTVEWRKVAEGVEYASIALDPRPSLGDGVLHAVRIDPTRARVRALAASREGGKARTARRWREEFHLAAVINAGMYQKDYSTHTGFFRVGAHVNSPAWVKDYQSILLIGPGQPGLPAAGLEDAGPGASAGAYQGWETVIQNLRLIRGPGASVWKENGRRWSEAAVAVDGQGRLLFLHCRSPFSMHELNAVLLSLPLGIVRAMHVEGGPEASLSVKGGGVALDLAGSYETGFNENEDNRDQWPLPNVLGVEAGR